MDTFRVGRHISRRVKLLTSNRALIIFCQSLLFDEFIEDGGSQDTSSSDRGYSDLLLKSECDRHHNTKRTLI